MTESIGIPPDYPMRWNEKAEVPLTVRAGAGDPEAMKVVYEATAQGKPHHDAAPITDIEFIEKNANGTVLRLVSTVPPETT